MYTVITMLGKKMQWLLREGENFFFFSKDFVNVAMKIL